MLHPHPTSAFTTASSFHVAGPSISDVPQASATAKLLPDHRSVLAGAGSTAWGALPSLPKGARRLDDKNHQTQPWSPQTRANFISTPAIGNRSPSSRQRSLSPTPPRVPPLPLETKRNTVSSSDPPPLLIRGNFESMNYPPDQQFDEFRIWGSSGRFRQRISIPTTSNDCSYTTARSRSQGTRTTISGTTQSPFPPDADRVEYPLPQLPVHKASGSRLFGRDEEESIVSLYDTTVGVVSGWRGDEEGHERRGKMADHLSAAMVFPPTPSSSSFDLANCGSNIMPGRSRPVTPGGMAFTTSRAGFDERGRTRVRGLRRPVSVAVSAQEAFRAGTRSAVVSNLPVSTEPDPLPELHTEEDRDSQKGRPPASQPVQQYVHLMPSHFQQNPNMCSGSLPSLSHHPPSHHHQPPSSTNHASPHSRRSLGSLSETQFQSKPASSFIASAGTSELIQNETNLFAGGASTAPPPIPPPPVAEPVLQHAQPILPIPNLPAAGVPSALSSPFGVSGAPPPPQLEFGVTSPPLRELGTGISLPSIHRLLMQTTPLPFLQQQAFSPQLDAGIVPIIPLSSPTQPQPPPLSLNVGGFGSPAATGGQLAQALELLIALVNQNSGLIAALEQQRLEQLQ